MKFGVVVFPGSNCDKDLIYVLKNLMGQDVVALWHKDHDLQGADFIMLPGGFSYGDYLRSGAIARFSPIMESVIKHCSNGGYAMGICNGFQILCEAGLLPGVLFHNDNQKFISKNVFIKSATSNSAVTAGIGSDKALKIPIAHGEGRYFAKPDVLKQLNENEQVIFRYCTEDGRFNRESNPNGSLENIAGVMNAGRNVFGMMPHPERAADPDLGNTDGRSIFDSLMATVSLV